MTRAWLPGVFPPLVGSEWVTGPPETLVRIILNGLQGPIEVAGQTYNGAMPAWAQQLSGQEIAAGRGLRRAAVTPEGPCAPRPTRHPPSTARSSGTRAAAARRPAGAGRARRSAGCDRPMRGAHPSGARAAPGSAPPGSPSRVQPLFHAALLVGITG